MKNLFTILFTISCFLTYAADLYVVPGGTAPNYSSIHTAVNAAADGDRVLVAPGVYIENVSMPAISITLIPMSDGGNYTISGSFEISASAGSSIKSSTIVGAIIQGDFEEENNTTSTSGSFINEFNIINCEFLQNFYPNYGVITNIYYSTFYSANQFSGMFKEIIGNEFLNEATNPRQLNCKSIKSSLQAATTLYGGDKVLKVYGNHFINSQFSLFGNSTNEWLEEVHIANNFFEHTNNSPYSGSNMNYNMLKFSSFENYQIPTFLVENNTFMKIAGNGIMGWAYHTSGSYTTNIIRNNMYYSSTTWSSSSEVFYLSCQYGIATVAGNLFNSNAWPITVTTSDLSNGNNSYFTGNLSGGSLSSADNFFSSSFSSGDISASSGIVTNSSATNKGLDIMECRDIDNTQNDIGTWGGPHSWDNYHSTGTGKGRIIDIQMPSTIYGLPGVTFEVKSKAIRTN